MGAALCARYLKRARHFYILIIITITITIIIGNYFLTKSYLNTFNEKNKAINLVKKFENTPTGNPIEKALQDYVEQLQLYGVKSYKKNLPIAWKTKKVEYGVYLVSYELYLKDKKVEFIWKVWIDEDRISAYNENACQVMG